MSGSAIKTAGRRLAMLASTTITAAATAATTAITGLAGVTYIIIQAALTYGSGGTTVDVYLQTSLDGGVTWIDIANLSFAKATASKVSAVNTTVALAAGTVPGDAALAANTIVNGLIGDRIRLKYVSVGVYADDTKLQVDAVVKG